MTKKERGVLQVIKMVAEAGLKGINTLSYTKATIQLLLDDKQPPKPNTCRKEKA